MSDYGQYGEGQYGEGQYGEPYDPAYGSDYNQTERLPEPASSPPSNKRILSILGGVIVVCVVLLVLALVGVFDFGDKTSGSPRTAATALLEAAKNGDVTGARKVLCQDDLDGGTAGIIASKQIADFSVDAVSEGSDSATVTATVKNGTGNAVVAIPVKKEKGAWKVCLPLNTGIGPSASPSGSSSTGSSVAPSTPVTTPVTTTPAPTTSGSTGGTTVNVCESSTTAQMTAQVFVGALALGAADLAKGCVFHKAVPDATIDSLAAGETLFSQVSASGSKFVFQSTDGAKKLTVTVTKESDGKFYVTGLTQS